MSYKLDLSHLTRGTDTSINAQLVDLVRSAIARGDLQPGQKLPTTRALAEEAGLNHLTVVRAYRRLAELGYVTASRGRGTFVRSAPPAAGGTDGRCPSRVAATSTRSSPIPGSRPPTTTT
jgi:DNA-binding transcriptional regulator YhcF (GntR family)